MPQVPLVIYDSQGNRTVIGTADVEHSGGSFVISGTITDEHYKNLIRGNVDNPDWYSICTLDDDIQEAAIVPPMAVPQPLYKNVFKKE